MMSSDTAAAVAFLEAWEPDGPWLLTAVEPDTGNIETRAFDDPEPMRHWIQRQQDRRNVYFSVNRTRPGLTRKAAKNDICELVALHTDVDPPKTPGLDLGLAQQRILDRLKAHIPPPSVIVFSGGGYQGFWRLDEPVLVNGNIAELESYNIAIERALGGDHCHNIDRIMRVPGTVNLPDRTKRNAGRTAVTAELIYFDPDRVYTLADFTAYQPGGSTNGASTDKSRSAAAFRLAGRLKREGKTFEEWLEALQADPELATWLRDKGNERQLWRAWDRADATTQTKPIAAALTGADFMNSFVAPDWLISGIVQRGRLYACTSLTGHGKTAVWLYNACMMQAGRRIGHIETAHGNALWLAGENPEDLKARMWGMVRTFNLAAEHIPYVLPGAFPLTEEGADLLRREIAALGVPLDLIVPDTAASFFPSDDENDNVQAGQYGRTLRSLTACPGNPAVVVPCHPVKNAARDNLLPRGGGAFLNELDGNLVLWSDQIGETTTLHWQGKIRGPDFSPITYRLKSISTGHQDTKGRDVMTIVAQPIDEIEAANQAKQSTANEDAVLRSLHRNPEWSFTKIAQALGWLNDKGEAERYRVHRALKALEKDKLVKNFRGKWGLTDAGKTTLQGQQE